MAKETAISAIESRVTGLQQWLEDRAPYARFDQRHLDGGSVEQAYWHLGYETALRDALGLIEDPTTDSDDKSNPSRRDDPGA